MNRAALCLLLICLSWLRVSAGVVWLHLGETSQPLLSPAGTTLTSEEFFTCSMVAYTASGDTRPVAFQHGLDVVAEGVFAGIVHLDVHEDVPITLWLLDPPSGLAAELGSGMLRGDDFAPRLDLDTYHITTPILSWRQQVTLTATASRGGYIEGITGEHPPGSRVSLAARAHPFYSFIRWDGDVPDAVRQDPDLDLLLDTDRELHAVFGAQVPDSWLMRHFGTVSVDLDADPDKDGLSNRLEFEYGTDPQAADMAAQTLSLTAGWNLVAFSVVPPPGTRTSDLFDTANVPISWQWNPWQQCYEQLAPRHPLAGVWLYAIEASQVTIEGHAVRDPTLRLYPGWNLLGPGQESILPANPELQGRPWTWWNKRQVYVPLDAAQSVSEGSGFWLHAAEPILLELEPGDRQ